MGTLLWNKPTKLNRWCLIDILSMDKMISENPFIDRVEENHIMILQVSIPIMRILVSRKGSHLESLNLKNCKAYLRKHDLRISGTKVCIQRNAEHQRLKDGNSESLYPRSSLVINCTGDVWGDVVLFTQKVYEKFDKMTRLGRVLGKRTVAGTVAGRVVKESYGAAKQQHIYFYY
ncbi:hypothetical protein M0R45_001525 [Rubus argutus]|uniref:DUF7699 domain-containing protein n=1 Tax=Rubus argutus TaxID=59490 RepID=A0AAW1VHA3_RUBAR